MSQTVNPLKQDIPGLPRKPLTHQQQLDAISRVQSQAEARVELGLKLFKAAENHTRSQNKMLEQIKAEQQQLRDQVNEDVAKSLHTYDQWVGQMDENFTRSLQNLESKIEKLQENWMATQQRIEAMIERSAEMFALTHGMDNPVSPEALKTEVPTEPPHAISIAPAEVTEQQESVDPPQADESMADPQTQQAISPDTDKVTQDTINQPRLKAENGAMYTDLIKQLRQRADERKSEE